MYNFHIWGPLHVWCCLHIQGCLTTLKRPLVSTFESSKSHPRTASWKYSGAVGKIVIIRLSEFNCNCNCLLELRLTISCDLCYNWHPHFKKQFKNSKPWNEDSWLILFQYLHLVFWIEKQFLTQNKSQQKFWVCLFQLNFELVSYIFGRLAFKEVSCLAGSCVYSSFCFVLVVKPKEIAGGVQMTSSVFKRLQVGPTPESNSILKCILSPKRF